MASTLGDQIEACQDRNLTVLPAEPDDLDSAVRVPQAFDKLMSPYVCLAHSSEPTSSTER
jgi:hypothetical protein